ncbi:MAG: hypothetical protein AAB505_02400 [Patescibacteria group bacterium]
MRATSDKEKSYWADRLKDLGVKRQEVLKDLIEKNSLAATTVLLSPEVIGSFPPEIQDQFESRVQVTGVVKAYQFDDFDQPEKSRLVYTLKQPKEKELFLPTGLTTPSLVAGAKVEVTGYKIGQFLLADQNFGAIRVTQPAPAIEAIGDQKTLVVLVNFLDSNSTPPFTPEQAESIVFGGQFQNFFKEQSYNKISFSGDVSGWHTVPRDNNSTNCAWPTVGDGGELDNFLLESVKNLEQYDRMIILSDSICLGAGFSTIGKGPLTLGGNDYYLSVAQIGRMYQFNQPAMWGNQPFPWTNIDYLLSHEVGHSLGLFHGNGWNCENDPFLGGDCQNVEYGNTFDVMGAYINSLHFNGFYKERLGWLEPRDVIKIDRSGRYEINNLEKTTGKRMAKIQILNSTTTPFYVEHRRGVGFDSRLNSPELSANQAGLIVNNIVPRSNLYVNFPNAIMAHLLDMSPNPNLQWSDDTRQATLNPSSPPNVFANSGYGITLTTVATTSSSMIFDVALARPVCERQAPSLDQTFWSNTAFIGNQGALSFWIRNRDAFACGSSDFTVTPTLPHGWGYHLDPKPPITLAPEDMIMQNMTFSIPPDQSPGGYEIDVSVVNQASQLVTKINLKIEVFEEPTINQLSPAAGPTGANVKINGSGFGALNRVTLESPSIYHQEFLPSTNAGQTITFTVPSMIYNTACGCEVPTPSGVYRVQVLPISSGGASSNSVDFSITPQPRTSVAPSTPIPIPVLTPGPEQILINRNLEDASSTTLKNSKR